jgi:hypothetical protein
MKIWLEMFLEKNPVGVDSLRDLIDKVYSDAHAKGYSEGYRDGGTREGSVLFSSDW